MSLLRRLALALFALLMLQAAPLRASEPPAEGLPAKLAADVAPDRGGVIAQPHSNAEIRQWYNDRVAVIPNLDRIWRDQGVSVEERARRVQEIRHNARIQARSFMADPQEVADLRARDQAKYGHPDGPSFDDLVAQNRERGLDGDAVYEAIIGSSRRTNAEYNAKFGVQTADPAAPRAPPVSTASP